MALSGVIAIDLGGDERADRANVSLLVAGVLLRYDFTMTFQIHDLPYKQLASAASLWERGWHDAHAQIVPHALVQLRTSDSFAQRLEALWGATRVSIHDGQVVGLCMTNKDELYQMYIAPQARRTGLAQALIVDAERRLKRAGHKSAWLACAMGNNRAARFYAKAGWCNVGVQTVDLETMGDPFPLAVWRYEKRLS